MASVTIIVTNYYKLVYFLGKLTEMLTETKNEIKSPFPIAENAGSGPEERTLPLQTAVKLLGYSWAIPWTILPKPREQEICCHPRHCLHLENI